MPTTTDFQASRGTAILTIPAGDSVSTAVSMGGCVLRAFVPVSYPIASGTFSINSAPTGFDGTTWPLVSLHQAKSGGNSFFDGTAAVVQGISQGTYYSFDSGDNFGAMIQFVNVGTLATAGTFVLIGKVPN